uniref:Uncharacterized protein n=1 Tax=Cacopsylla melanoneura TaxID=428564 RepID=A0A8D9FF66_9HEMI
MDGFTTLETVLSIIVSCSRSVLSSSFCFIVFPVSSYLLHMVEFWFLFGIFALLVCRVDGFNFDNGTFNSHVQYVFEAVLSILHVLFMYCIVLKLHILACFVSFLSFHIFRYLVVFKLL